MYTSFKSKGRCPGILRRSLIKNIGCPCYHPTEIHTLQFNTHLSPNNLHNIIYKKRVYNVYTAIYPTIYPTILNRKWVT